jgi:quinoprotein glucose dehydrogenase
VRAEAVKALAALGTPPPALLAIARNALKDPEPAVRIEALRIQTAIAPAEARRVLPTVMARGTVAERQNALVLGGKLAPADTEALLAGWIEDLVRGRFPSEVTLELLETAAAKGTPALKEKLAKFEASRPKDDLGPYREALYGGNPDEGRRLFRKADTGCLRCHKAEDDTGGEAGPGLDGIAKKHKRDYLLASIVAPNAHFAPGFESLILTLKDGTITGGTARKETPTQITLVTPENTTVVVKKADVKKRERGASGMPEGFGALLTKRELRDIVEFLATLK